MSLKMKSAHTFLSFFSSPTPCNFRLLLPLWLCSCNIQPQHNYTFLLQCLINAVVIQFDEIMSNWYIYTYLSYVVPIHLLHRPSPSIRVWCCSAKGLTLSNLYCDAIECSHVTEQPYEQSKSKVAHSQYSWEGLFYSIILSVQPAEWTPLPSLSDKTSMMDCYVSLTTKQNELWWSDPIVCRLMRPPQFFIVAVDGIQWQ